MDIFPGRGGDSVTGRELKTKDIIGIMNNQEGLLRRRLLAMTDAIKKFHRVFKINYEQNKNDII